MSEVGVLQTGARRFMRTAAVLLVLVLISGLSLGLSAAASNDAPKCDGVFNGKTPIDVSKTADKAQAIPGETVTYTFAWVPTGSDTSVIIDCFQVDGDAKSPLNPIVEASNVELSIPQTDAYSCIDADHLCYDVAIAIPNNSDLIGHSVADRGKLTRGNTETRTNLLEIEVVAPPCTANCGGGTTGGDTGGTTTGDNGGTTTGDNGGTTTGDNGGTTTGDNGGTTTGGTTSGGTTGSSVGDEVLGNVITKAAPLATTGSETTTLALVGTMMLMVGVALRFGRFGREVFATASETADDKLHKALRSRSRNTTCGK